MKARHLIFCCNQNCLRREVQAINNLAPSIATFTAHERILRIGAEEWRFFVDINQDKEKLYGMLLTDYRTCGNYDLDPRLEAILKTHIRGEL